MKERWRVPVKPLAVKDEMNWATAELGRATSEFSARFTENDIHRIKQGYVCIRCWEPHEVSFPERCLVCGFPMRLEQVAFFTEKFMGTERDPRATRIESALSDLDDRHDKNFHVAKTGIIVPRKVVSDG